MEHFKSDDDFREAVERLNGLYYPNWGRHDAGVASGGTHQERPERSLARPTIPPGMSTGEADSE